MQIFELSDVISFLAFLVAILSALYSRWTYSEAKKSNEIAIHNKKLETYKSFNMLRFKMSEKACSVSYADIVHFFEPANHSEFYFEEKTSKKIKKYFDVCFEIADLSRKISRKNTTEEKLELYYSEQDVLFKQEFNLAQELDKELRNKVRVR